MRSSNQKQMASTINSRKKNMVISVYLREIKPYFSLFPPYCRETAKRLEIISQEPLDHTPYPQF